MLVYTLGVQSKTLVTLNESKTLTTPYYLFVFTHITLGTIVNKIVISTDDLSLYPTRYNEFNFDLLSLFSGAMAGQWSYEIYEQESSSNTNITGLNLVEHGKMLLKPSTLLNKQGYEPTTTFTGYGG